VTGAPAPVQALGRALCPWLRPAFDQIDSARRSGRLGHAWLVTGPVGIGKLNLALAAANRLLGDSTAPGVLGPAEAVAALNARHVPTDHHPDLHWIHPEEDKHSIAVEQIRGVTEALSLTAHRGKAKVVIVEPADAMTTAAANALLKTLEEPSADTYLWLLSHQPGRLPATIRSRCQRLDLRRPSLEALADWLDIAERDAITDLWAMTGGAPLRVAALLREKDISINKELEDSLVALSSDRTDPVALAETWAKGDVELTLSWLKARLADTIRQRSGARGSTAITVRSHDTLHNAWQQLTLKSLFEQYDKAERLLGQLGSGINLELAMQALLVGFQPNRGQP
jgi:DNA polymerase-3 subunit delta'